MLRELTHEEVGFVAGGTDIPGVNEVFSGAPTRNIVGNGTVVQDTENHVVAVDEDLDGTFDQAWQQDSNGIWFTTIDGVHWIEDIIENGPYNEIQNQRSIYERFWIAREVEG